MDVIFRLQVLAVVAVVFWVGIYLANRKYDLESKGVDLSFGVLLWKTEKGLGLLDKIANKYKRFVSAYGKFSAVLGMVLMFVFFYLIFSGTVQGMITFLSEEATLHIPEEARTRPIIIPGVNIPLIVGILSLGVVLLVHEPAHGITMRRLKLKAKSTGLAVFLFVIPGAFVEQDEEEFQEAPPEKRMQVAGAGPIANIITALISLLLVIALIQPAPVIFSEGVAEGSPAEEAGLESSLKITGLNEENIGGIESFQEALQGVRSGDNVKITTEDNEFWMEIPSSGVYIDDVMENGAADNAGIPPSSRVLRIGEKSVDSLQNLSEILDNKEPGQEVEVETDKDNYTVRLGTHPDGESGYLGVYLLELPEIDNGMSVYEFEEYVGVQLLHALPYSETRLLNPDLMFVSAFEEVIGRSMIDERVYESTIPWPFIELLKWIFALSLLVALFNLLPLKPLDGGHIFEGLIEKITGSEAIGSRSAKVMSYLVLGLIILNFVLVYA